VNSSGRAWLLSAAALSLILLTVPTETSGQAAGPNPDMTNVNATTTTMAAMPTSRLAAFLLELLERNHQTSVRALPRPDADDQSDFRYSMSSRCCSAVRSSLRTRL